MGSENQNQVLKVLSTLKEFRTPIQLGALSIIILYVVWNGQYTIQQQYFVSGMFFVIFFLSVIPIWRKTEVDAELEGRRIDADLERGKHWTDTTFRESTERTRVESIQRKQGALDAFDSIKRFLEKRKEIEPDEDKKIAYQQILEQIEAMKAGANSFALGFHEQVEREMQNGRGRFGRIEDIKK